MVFIIYMEDLCTMANERDNVIWYSMNYNGEGWECCQWGTSFKALFIIAQLHKLGNQMNFRQPIDVSFSLKVIRTIKLNQMTLKYKHKNAQTVVSNVHHSLNWPFDNSSTNSRN